MNIFDLISNLQLLENSAHNNDFDDIKRCVNSIKCSITNLVHILWKFVFAHLHKTKDISLYVFY